VKWEGLINWHKEILPVTENTPELSLIEGVVYA